MVPAAPLAAVFSQLSIVPLAHAGTTRGTAMRGTAPTAEEAYKPVAAAMASRPGTTRRRVFECTGLPSIDARPERTTPYLGHVAGIGERVHASWCTRWHSIDRA